MFGGYKSGPRYRINNALGKEREDFIKEVQ